MVITHNTEKTEYIFGILFIVFGLIFIIITPPFQVPDEQNHFFRAYQISQGNIISQKRFIFCGDEIPQSLFRTSIEVSDNISFHPENKQSVKKILNAFTFSLEKEKTQFVNFGNTAILSPAAYIPQVIGIEMGKILNAPPIALMYLGRFFNLIFATLVISYAIRITPFLKNVLFLIALMPMSIFLMGSLSADVATISLSLLLVSVFLAASYNSDSFMTKKNIVLMFIVSVWVALCKSGYFLLAFLYFIIPVKSAKSPNRYYAIGLSLVMVSLCSFLIWAKIANDLFMLFPKSRFSSYNELRIFIMSHPVEYMSMIIRNLSDHHIYYLSGFVGTLGWLDTKLSPLFVFLYLIILSLTATFDGKKDMALGAKNKLLSCAVAAGFTALLLTMFLYATEAGSNDIVRIQGRYFIPISPLIFLILNNSKVSGVFNQKNFNMFIPPFVFLSLVYTIRVVIRRYYF